jgi:hypothetical protein
MNDVNRRSFLRGASAAGIALNLRAGQTAKGEEATIGGELRVLEVPPVDGANEFYVGNRAPLLANPLIKLPIGSIRPKGWLNHQLKLMAAGYSGHLEEISPFCKFEGNEWTSPTGDGKFGWEEVPYWLRGYIDLGYVLQDSRIIAGANRWVDAVIATQQPNGYFGSKSNLESERVNGARTKMLDLWPNMVMLFPLRTLYEATGDARILPFMTNYFRWQMTVPLQDFLSASWQKTRGGDNLDSIYWLYNRTGDSWLLDLARVNHERTLDWIGGIPRWHNVDFAECFREPAQYFQQTRDLRYLSATVRDYDVMRKLYGQVPGGMYGGDENCRPGFNGPRQATETCGFVEMMFSAELLVSITGDVIWADRAEDVAFNSFPAAMTADLKGLHYLTAPNQIQLDRQNKSPMIQNQGDMFSYNPYQYRCCQHNSAFGWPYYAEHLWMATRNNGLAKLFYAPSEVKAKIAGGHEIQISETTGYPFDEHVNLKFSTANPVRFPLLLRIPGWCDKPVVTINGKASPIGRAAKGWISIDRLWHDNDQLHLELPMQIETQIWANNRNTVSVNRGPLSYSLKIGERWQRAGGTDTWPGQEVYPTTPWNYGLIVDTKDPSRSFELVRSKDPLQDQPFSLEAAPISLRAKGKRIPQWKQEPNGMVAEVQPGPVRSDQPIEDVTLIPMGCARLRISSFPQIGEGSQAHVWQDNVPIILASAADHYDSPSAINDGLTPKHSSDAQVPRFVWPDFESSPTREFNSSQLWVEYRYSRPVGITSSEVYWAVDEGRGGCRLPDSWRLVWLDGTQWKPVEDATNYGVAVDRFNQVRFKPVMTSAIRLEVRPQFRMPGAKAGPLARVGIYEWRVLS